MKYYTKGTSFYKSNIIYLYIVVRDNFNSF